MAVKKAIYTKVGGQYYRINQDTITPTEVVRMPRTHSQMNTDAAARIIKSDIWVNTLENADILTNKEEYDILIHNLKKYKIQEIPTIQNHFVMYCDYSVYNCEGKQINHNAFTRQLQPEDMIYILGVSNQSELIYKQVKTFNSNITLNVRNDYPMGIMHNASHIRYTLQINDISIYQDLQYSDVSIHSSTDCDSYPIATVLETMEKVYSTHDNGMVIAAVEVPFVPRKIALNLNIALDNVIVVYDESDIYNIIADNNGQEPVYPDKEIIFNGGGAHGF